MAPEENAKLAVPVVVGTRPEAIKLVPLILALGESRHFHPIVVSTGQHHDMVAEIFGLAGIETDVDLMAGSRHAPLTERVQTVMGRFDDFCDEWFGATGETIEHRDEILSGHYPVAVMVHGDTSSAMACALAAFHLRIPVVHVEAGLRTGGLNLEPFPEELNRRLIGSIACFHCAPTSINRQNLVRENVDIRQVFVTGNTGIDALHWAAGLDVRFADPAVQELHDGDDRLVVVTAHRRENWGAGLDGIAAGVARIAERHADTRFVVPMHPNPRVREQLTGALGALPNVLLTEPLGYASFARLLRRAHFVITDSGGIQEEAPSLDKPVLVARASTERLEGFAAGTLVLVGTDPDRIAAEGERMLSDADAYAAVAGAENPYGDGSAATRIVGALEHLLGAGEPPVGFRSGYDTHAILRAAGYEEVLHPSQVPAEARGEGPRRPTDALWPT